MSILRLAYEGYNLMRHDRWPREKMLEFSLAKFRQVVKFAFSNCPFYRDLYENQGIREDDLEHVNPQDLPIIDKDMVRDNFRRIAPPAARDLAELEARWRGQSDDLTADPESIPTSEPFLQKDGYILIHSSGSTGKPCNFLYDSSAITTIEANMIRLSLCGKNSITIRDFPIKVLYVASVGAGYASTALAFSGIKKYGAKSLILNVQDPWDSWPEKIKQFNPNYLAGYPSCIQLIASMQEKGMICIHPKKIITGGEPLPLDTATYFEKLFGADVIDYYACTESLIIGIGTTWYDGLYLLDDMNYVEVDSEQRLIITPLYNMAFPLVRYRLNDIVEGFNRSYGGPRPYTHIDKILGRSEEMMWFKNKEGRWDFLHPLFIDDLDVPGIKQYQFVQTGDTSFTVRVVAEPGVSQDQLRPEIEQQIISFLTRKSLTNVKYSIEFCDGLRVHPVTGKAKLVEKAVDLEGEVKTSPTEI